MLRPPSLVAWLVVPVVVAPNGGCIPTCVSTIDYTTLAEAAAFAASQPFERRAAPPGRTWFVATAADDVALVDADGAGVAGTIERTATTAIVRVPDGAADGDAFTLRAGADEITLTVDDEPPSFAAVAADGLAIDFDERTTVDQYPHRCTTPFDAPVEPTTFDALAFSLTLDQDQAASVVVDVWRADEADRDDETAPRALDTARVLSDWLEPASGRFVIPLDGDDEGADFEVRLRSIVTGATGPRASSADE